MRSRAVSRHADQSSLGSEPGPDVAAPRATDPPSDDRELSPADAWEALEVALRQRARELEERRR